MARSPEIAALRMPLTAGTSPTRITCAPAIAPEPVGASRPSALVVAGGSAVLPESRIGARIGGAISTEAAIAACQSSVGAIVTAVGWVPATWEGKTASATPAASAIGSCPDTRVVFLVASAGNPSRWPAPACSSSSSCSSVLMISRVAPPPQPAIDTQAASPAIHAVHRIGRGR